MAVAACLKASQSVAVGYAGQTQLGGGMNGIGGGVGGHLQSQLTRSLERILEDAHLSGELKLSGRKLKDFPKAAGKYNLSDTVIADLSRNRFCELPDDITCLAFLERLLVYHNTIRSVPETIRGLHSLTYLDLRNNQLSALPREICTLPLQVLLVSNNRLATLPDELGRMDKLTELDAACNQITHLPARMGDLRSLRSLNLRSNQLVYLPRDLTCLQLAFLDISSNKIATLPVELRQMSSLVDLELCNNPLTSPPASLCVRGLVHVFKYLETVAAREEKTKTGLDGHATLRRTALAGKNSGNSLLDTHQRNRRAHVDSGYCTSDGGFEGGQQVSLAAHNSAGGGLNDAIAEGAGGVVCWEEEFRKNAQQEQHQDRKQLSNNNSNDISPEGDLITPDGTKADDKARALSNYQTYREYKEALRQQRNLDSVYRSKDQPLTPDSGGSATDSPVSNVSPYTKSISSSSVYSSSSQSSPVSPHHAGSVQKMNQINANGTHTAGGANHSSPLLSPNRNGGQGSAHEEGASGGGGTPNKRPVQKVIPSRNISSTHQSQQPSPTHLNGNHHPSFSAGSSSVAGSNGTQGKIPLANGSGKTSSLAGAGSRAGSEEYAYVKPNSPCKTTSGILTHNNVPPSSIPKPTAPNGGGLTSPVQAGQKPLTATVGYVNNAKPGQKTNKTVSWNRDVPTEKLSFTMRREFDKQKEETELIEQLRQIIETRLKMSLPEDIAPALMDGVVLCHLANHVRPRSVGSIHVPSSAVPKLTMARCRRNVDYFLDACRRIGVDEELICSCQDIVPSTTAEPTLTSLEASGTRAADDEEEGRGGQGSSVALRPPNPLAMYRTIAALLSVSTTSTAVAAAPGIGPGLSAIGLLRRPRSPPPPPPPTIGPLVPVCAIPPAAATNTNSSTVPEKSFDCDLAAAQAQPGLLTSVAMHGSSQVSFTGQIVEDRRNVPVTLDLRKCDSSKPNGGRKRKFPSSRSNRRSQRTGGAAGDMQSNLNEIIEECEYDSDIGKFRCRTDDGELREYEDSETSLTSCDDDCPNGMENEAEEGCDAFTPTNAQPIVGGMFPDMGATVSSNDLDTPTTEQPLTGAKAVDGGNENFNITQTDEEEETNAGRQKVVTKRIEFFENAASGGRKILNSEISVSAKQQQSPEELATTEEYKGDEKKAGDTTGDPHCFHEVSEQRRESEHPMISTILCLGTFIFTVVYLYFYPLSS
ncbi:leucine-rich repeat and calponin homology domain-containing protein isoform X2 [Anopheles ziemanni]|uniref:leucine-rich repeat and calponin homology domain-containing protein isoform X2 n=1 Tax=Anopheles coustani TaxID=139045 RepID=UPI00265B389A|nr:leucine-rich repeat and calponin homology domain-containing protein isoform X2 [Anopheles coustani]XP_058167997.1 leucine-rich repeat and calponin homology domain-containing protein isoform X2 [Anopheles ziemanni]